MKNILLCIFSFALIITAKAQKHELVKLWETDSVLKVPESVLFDAENKVLYVANIDGTQPWGKDSSGSIGKVGLDGKVISVDWVSGLHAPKGMGLFNGKLYVADLTELVEIDISSGKITNKLTIPSAEGLNDVSVDKEGNIYVSDSRGKKVFKVKDGKAELFLENLKGPNGVLAHKKDFFVLDAGSMFKMNADKSLLKIADGMEGGTDGIENVKGNEFIISCWAGVIWYIKEDGSKQLLLDSREEKKNAADIGINALNKIIYVPTFWRNTIVAYQVK